MGKRMSERYQSLTGHLEKKLKERRFIGEKFLIINICEAVKLYQYFQNIFRNLENFP